MNSFGTLSQIEVDGQTYQIHSLRELENQGINVGRLPFSLRILLENMLRHENGLSVSRPDIENMLGWKAKESPKHEIAFTPSRVLLQDFTGVPCVVDFASMRDAMSKMGANPEKINPLQPAELVIDHSVQVDAYGSDAAMQINLDLEFQRNNERYEFLKWGQEALENFRVVPPNTGICHQVNLEHLSRVVFGDDNWAYFDTLVGTDSHTTMVNGLGVLGWGVGGIEAEAAMLGQPISMLIPQVVGVRLEGQLKEGATATDLVLTLTELLRNENVVGKFVEFFGSGVPGLPLADRATIGNMSPEFGSTCALFPIDEETLRYLQVTGRSEEHVARVREYCKAQGMFYSPDDQKPDYSVELHLDLSKVEPSVAGPRRPQDRSKLAHISHSLHGAFPEVKKPEDLSRPDAAGVAVLEKPHVSQLSSGHVVIAAITSCTNTSNPSVMVAAGLVAKKANALGLKPKPWVKTSLAPGSQVVTQYLAKSGLLPELENIGFHVVGYGCTTCIGNSGPLPEEISALIQEKDLVVASVLSGNRNFEGRVNPEVKANYLMSPPLVVAFALAGTVEIDLTDEPLGVSESGEPVFLKDVWPTQAEIAEVVENNIDREMFVDAYESVFTGDDRWRAIQVDGSGLYSWDDNSTYIAKAPYFDDMSRQAPERVPELQNMKCLAWLGDSVTTDHISPAGSIKVDSPAGKYLMDRGVRPHMFNSYGSRRGNHEVMIRGTFANVRLRNKLAPGTEGGFTTFWPTSEVMTIYDAAMAYDEMGVPLVVLAGKEYGAGSSRDWAAKGTLLLGVKAVIAESFERIHRSNLVGMGVLPLQFAQKQSAESLGLDGTETFTLHGFSDALAANFAGGNTLEVSAVDGNGKEKRFTVVVRIDTPMEVEYYRNGGILQYVMRTLLKS